MRISHVLSGERNSFRAVVLMNSFLCMVKTWDLCWRREKAGISVLYNPKTQIIHRKGKSRPEIMRSRFAFYEAMLILHENTPKRGGYFSEWLFVFGILFQATLKSEHLCGV
jgi:GT2 family glycosyltransferase